MTEIIFSSTELDKGGSTEVRSNELYYLSTRERSNLNTIIIPSGVTSAITFDTALPTDQYDLLTELYNYNTTYTATITNKTRYGFNVTNSESTPLMFNYRATRRTREESQTLYTVTANLSDDLGVVTGMTVGFGRTSDISGSCTFTDISANVYMYTITSPKHVEINDPITISGDTTFGITLVRDVFNVQFTVTDSGSTPIENAIILFNYETLYTNSSGITTFILVPQGNRAYEIYKDGYDSLSSSVNITFDTALTFVMTESEPEFFHITFSVLDGGYNPIEGASITLTTSIVQTGLTDDQGEFIFADVPDVPNATYSIAADGYQTYDSPTGFQTSNTTIEVQLSSE